MQIENLEMNTNLIVSKCIRYNKRSYDLIL